jgi:predicted RNase H-like HicB family nuclease
VSETYTAVYERDGERWLAKIAEEPGVTTSGPTLAAARTQIREALAGRLNTDAGALRVVDDFRMPAQVRAVQQEVKTARTEAERQRMLDKLTSPVSAVEWAKDLGISDRDPKTVEWLKSLEGQTVEIDHLCSTITMAEDVSRWDRDADGVPAEDDG